MLSRIVRVQSIPRTWSVVVTNSSKVVRAQYTVVGHFASYLSRERSAALY